VKVLPTVFVVDDDPIIVESLQAVLSAQGYIVKSFQTAEEFLVLNRSNAVGCVLIDLILPGMNGNELWKKLVAAGSMLSVIVVTGWIESLDLSWQRAPLGAVIEKPYDVSVLLSLVAEGMTDSLKRKDDRDRWRLKSS
jgi:FixJ family two-component response regulator